MIKSKIFLNILHTGKIITFDIGCDKFILAHYRKLQYYPYEFTPILSIHSHYDHVTFPAHLCFFFCNDASRKLFVWFIFLDFSRRFYEILACVYDSLTIQ